MFVKIEKCNSKNIIVRGVCGLPRDSSSVYRGFVVPITLHQKHLWSDVVELRDSDGKRVISWGRLVLIFISREFEFNDNFTGCSL